MDDVSRPSPAISRSEVRRLQEIEGNPLDADDLAMFAMFDREGWSAERRRAHIIAHAKAGSVQAAAE